MDKKLKNPSENGWAGENVFSTIVLVVLSAVLFVVGLFFINDMLVKPIMVILNGPVVRQGKALYTDAFSYLSEALVIRSSQGSKSNQTNLRPGGTKIAIATACCK